VVDSDGEIKVRWDRGRTSYFRKDRPANVRRTEAKSLDSPSGSGSFSGFERCYVMQDTSACLFGLALGTLCFGMLALNALLR